MNIKLSAGALVALLGALLALPAAAQKPAPDTIALRLTQVGDSAELVALLRRLPPVPAGVVPVFRISYDSTGARETVDALFQMPAAFDSAVSDVLLDYSVMQTARHGYGTALLTVHTGPDALIASYTPRKQTAPHVANVSVFQRRLQRFYESQRRNLPAKPFAVTLRIRVGADGVPETVHLLTALQSDEANVALVDLAHTLRFEPAKLDGHPVRVWVSVPVTIEPPAQITTRY